MEADGGRLTRAIAYLAHIGSHQRDHVHFRSQ